MQSHLATKTLSFFSIFKTNMTFHRSNHSNFIENGLCPWHFQSPNTLKLVIHVSVKSLFPFFGIKNMHILNNNGVKVFRKFKHFRNCVAIPRRNSCQFKVFNKLLYSPMWLDLDSSKETNSLGAKAFPRIRPPKKYFNLKLFGTCNFGGMVKTFLKITNFKQ